MKIVMIRHGQSKSNKARIVSGSQNTYLSENGKEELTLLKNSLNYPKTDIYVSSSLTRCLETFDILFPDEQLMKTEDNFREVCFGDIEGKHYIDADLDNFFINWLNKEHIGNAEHFDIFYNRIITGLKTLIKEMKDNSHESATIIAHSTVIKVLVKQAKNIASEEYKNISMKNGYGFIFDIDLVNDEIIFNDVKELDFK